MRNMHATRKGPGRRPQTLSREEYAKLSITRIVQKARQELERIKTDNAAIAEILNQHNKGATK